MKKTIFAIIGLVVFLTTKIYAYDDGDFQIWNTDTEEFIINKSTKITLEEEFQWADNANDFSYHHYDAGFVYSLNSYLDVGANYRQVFEKKKGKFKPENRPHLNAALKYEIFGFKLGDRNRVEYRNFDYQSDIWRYRNKFSIKFPWSVTAFKIQPYLADEIFVGLEDGGLNRNRFYAGFGLNIVKNIKGEIYYLLQRSKGSGQWTDTNVLGIKLKTAF